MRLIVANFSAWLWRGFINFVNRLVLSCSNNSAYFEPLSLRRGLVRSVC